MRGARREHPPQWGCDRRATKQMARRRPAPPGWGSLACWLRCSLLTDRCGYARRSRLASKPNSLQQNRNLFLNEPLVGKGRTPGHSASSPWYATQRTASCQFNVRYSEPSPDPSFACEFTSSPRSRARAILWELESLLPWNSLQPLLPLYPTSLSPEVLVRQSRKPGYST